MFVITFSSYSNYCYLLFGLGFGRLVAFFGENRLWGGLKVCGSARCFLGLAWQVRAFSGYSSKLRGSVGVATVASFFCECSLWFFGGRRPFVGGYSASSSKSGWRWPRQKSRRPNVSRIAGKGFEPLTSGL